MIKSLLFWALWGSNEKRVENFLTWPFVAELIGPRLEVASFIFQQAIFPFCIFLGGYDDPNLAVCSLSIFIQKWNDESKKCTCQHIYVVQKQKIVLVNDTNNYVPAHTQSPCKLPKANVLFFIWALLYYYQSWFRDYKTREIDIYMIFFIHLYNT